MPVGAEVLSISQQEKSIFIWAKVDTEAEKENRVFRSFETGVDIPDHLALVLIGPVRNGDWVAHVFEDIGTRLPVT